MYTFSDGFNFVHSPPHLSLERYHNVCVCLYYYTHINIYKDEILFFNFNAINLKFMKMNLLIYIYNNK